MLKTHSVYFSWTALILTAFVFVYHTAVDREQRKTRAMLMSKTKYIAILSVANAGARLFRWLARLTGSD
jgi:hypothetical protein